MNKLQTWFAFHRPERRFHMLSHKLLNTSHILNDLNARRKVIQREIVELSKDVTICAKCQGACCSGDYDHFTFIDFLIRSFSDKPLKGYGVIWKPKPFYSLFFDKSKSIFGKNAGCNNAGPVKGCPNLGSHGCSLEVEDRPMRCVYWTCREFRESLPVNNLAKIAKLVKELDYITSKVIRIFDRM